MSGSDENQESIVKWIIRYVLMPFTLAIVGGWIALKVVNLEIDSRSTPKEDVAASIFATMTAVAPNNQVPPTQPATTMPPSATTEPTPTQEADAGGSGNPPASKPEPYQSPIVCGNVPFGWQLYTVQSGNTLFSLARNSGTTIEAIRQVNCLYGQLLAYQQIWLPTVYNEEPDPIVEVTRIVEPVVTITPTITVTEPVALPDLINDTTNLPTISVNCSTTLTAAVPPSCVTTVNLTVGNVGSAAANSFNIQVWLDPAQSVVLNQSVDFLGSGETAAFLLNSPSGGSCYDSDCTVCITVDSRGSVAEENEDNNLFCTTFPG